MKRYLLATPFVVLAIMVLALPLLTGGTKLSTLDAVTNAVASDKFYIITNTGAVGSRSITLDWLLVSMKQLANWSSGVGMYVTDTNGTQVGVGNTNLTFTSGNIQIAVTTAGNTNFVTLTAPAGSGGTSTSNNIPTSTLPGITNLANVTNYMFNADVATVFYFTLTNNCALWMTNGSDGQTVTLRLTQDATGNRTAVFANNTGGAETNLVRFGTDITGITLTTNAAKTDYVRLQYYKASDYWDVIGFVRSY